MTKIRNSRIFIVIITILICINGTLYALTKYQASEILYNASDGTSMDVNEALNDLYNKIETSNNFNLKKIVSAGVSISGSVEQEIGNYNLEKGRYLIFVSSATTEYNAEINIKGCSLLNLIDTFSHWNSSENYSTGRGGLRSSIYICEVSSKSTVTITEYMNYNGYYGKAQIGIYEI